MSDSLFFAIVIPVALTIAVTVLSRRAGTWTSALLLAYGGLLGMAGMFMELLYSGSSPASGSSTADPVLAVMALIVSVAVLAGLTMLISRRPFDFDIGRTAAAAASAASAGAQLLFISLFVLFSSRIASFLQSTGEREAIGEFGPGVSRTVLYNRWAVAVPILMLIAAVLVVMKRYRIRDRLAARLADPDPPRPHPGLIIFAVFLLALFVVFETGGK